MVGFWYISLVLGAVMVLGIHPFVWHLFDGV
jgi:hypothetical protein